MRDSNGPKSTTGRFFEDFHLEETIDHASPRTITEGDVALYHALTGNRFTLQLSNQFARHVGYHTAPVDDLFVFNAVFGLSVPDISWNARANLGYAGCDFLSQLNVGETIRARSTIIGLRETSDGDAGIIYVRTEGLDHRQFPILRFVRWVLIPKRDSNSKIPQEFIPDLPEAVLPITIPKQKLNRHWNDIQAGSPYRWEDYLKGEKIDHIDGVTVEDTNHMMSTQLYRNPARVHFNGHAMKQSPFGRRIVYGGHVMSLARALSYNGLANACIVAASMAYSGGINGGRHAVPVFGGDTVYAWSEVLDQVELENSV